MQGFLLPEIHHFSNSINKKVRSKSTALFSIISKRSIKMNI